MEIFKHDIKLDAMKKIESRRADRNRDSSSSYSNDNSNSNGHSHRNGDSPQDRRTGNEREWVIEKEMKGINLHSHQAPYSDTSQSRNVPASLSWDKDRDRDREFRRGNGGRECGRGGEERSYARSSATSLHQRNINSDEVSKLDQTLVSDR